jgi:hypothetical protein
MMNGPLREIHSALRGGIAHWKNIGPVRQWWANSPYLVGYCFWHCKKLAAYADKSNCEWHKRLSARRNFCLPLFSCDRNFSRATTAAAATYIGKTLEKLIKINGARSLCWCGDVDTSILQLTASVSLWRDARTLVAQYFWMETTPLVEKDIFQSISGIPPDHNSKINKPDDLNEQTKNTAGEWQDKD